MATAVPAVLLSLLAAARGAPAPGPAQPSPCEAAGIPAERCTRWEPGIPGGVPRRTRICATIDPALGAGVGDATQAIQAALDACPPSQVVMLPPGTYRIGSLFLRRPVVLRGAGPERTALQSTGPFAIMIGTWTHLGDPVRLAADAPRGATSLTVKDASRFSPGDMLHLDQVDDPAVVQGNPCPLLKRGAPGAWRSIGQMVEVVGRKGNVLALASPLHWRFTTALQAEVVPLQEPATRDAGVEDLRTVNGGIVVQYAAYSWIRNVETERVNGVHVALAGTYRFVLRDSYAHESATYSYGGTSYGYSIEWQGSDNLVENNVVHTMNKPFQFRASGGGNVVAYNHFDDSWSQPDGRGRFWFQELNVDSHCSFPHMELVEGNYAPHMGVATTWGNAGYLTFFRNRSTGRFRNITSPIANLAAVQLDARVVAVSVVGNVLGDPGVAGARYETATASTCREDVPFVYRLGYDSARGYCEFPSPPDRRVVETLLRRANLYHFGGKAVADPGQKAAPLPPSLYLREAPAFFAGAPWPWVDPAADVPVRELPASKRLAAIEAARGKAPESPARPAR